MLNAAPLPRFRLYTSPSLYARLAAEILTGRFYRGEDAIDRFEHAVATFLNSDNKPSLRCVAMPMARVAIYCAVKALVHPGESVVMSPYTIADVVNMVIAAGARPIFADVDPESGNLRIDEVERLIDNNTGAVLATHFYGCAADVAEIARICRQRKVWLIEDAAQAFGCKLHSRRVGTFGDVGIFSFGMYKNINAFYGGAAVVRDEDLEARLRAEIANYPREPLATYVPRLIKGVITDALTYPPVFKSFSFWLFRWAFLKNVHAINNRLVIDIDPKRTDTIPQDYLRRMSPAQARVLLPQIAGVEAANRERIRKAKLYYQGLKDISEIVLPPHRSDGSHIYTYYCIQVSDRRRLVRFMMKHGADTPESYHRNCADLPCFEAFARECPTARSVASSLVYLPTYGRYSDAEIRRNIGLIRDYYGYDQLDSSANVELGPAEA